MKYSASRLRYYFWLASLLLVAAAFMAAPRRISAQQPAPAASASTHASGNTPGNASAENEDRPTTPSDEQKELNVFRHAPIVAKIGQKMGMDVETTAKVFEAINFVIIILAIVIPIVRIVPRMLRQRSQTLNQDIQTAREATADANTRLSAVEAKLAGLDAEIQKFRAQVEQESREDEKRIKATLEEETVRIVSAAEQEITMAAVQARRGLRLFAADLAIEHAEKQLVLTPETDRALIAEFIADTSNHGATNGKGGAH
ncbi:MAG TPA: ATP synthase F0 subunit B [Terracidiphilus sp.]